MLLALTWLYWRRLRVLRRGLESGTGLVRLIEGIQSGWRGQAAAPADCSST